MPVGGDPSSDWESWRRSWQRSLRARNLSPKTVSLYLSAGRELVAHLERTGGPDEPGGLRREHVEGLILELQERGRTPSGVRLVYRSLQQLMKYLGQEGELERSPMEHMTAPLIPELTTPVLSDDDLRALLATCAGRDFVDLRDTALLRLFIATGGRRAEVAGLTVDAVELDTDTVRLFGKGRRERQVTPVAEDRPGSRAVHPRSAAGPLRRPAGAVAGRTQPGAAQLLRRRPGAHPPRPRSGPR